MNPAADRLAALLDQAGLRHELHAPAAGAPTATFQLGLAGEAPVAISARLSDPVLQLTAHGLCHAPAALPDARQLMAVNTINERWPLGRLYLGTDGHSCEASISLLVGTEPTPPEWLYLALDELGDLCRLIRAGALDGRTLEHALDATLAQQRLRLAEAPGGLTLLDVETALTRLGLQYRIADAGETLLLALHEKNHPELGIELSKRDRRYFNLIAHHPTSDPAPDPNAILWQLQQANRRILLGSCIFDPARAMLYHRSTLPLFWAPIDAARLSWLIDHAAAALDLFTLAPGD